LFDDQSLYRDPADEPDEAEIAQRRETIWKPYHAQLANELARIKAEHGIAALWDAHSIRSVLPRFFEGRLPDLNLGTAEGASCSPLLAEQLLAIGQKASSYTAVLNGRFKGGHITRQHGNPAQGVHAVQLEMTQCSYMQESWPFEYLPDVAAGVQPHVRRMLEAVLAFVEGSKIKT
jgi:N-formylglutamate deformylase